MTALVDGIHKLGRQPQGFPATGRIQSLIPILKPIHLLDSVGMAEFVIDGTDDIV